MATLTRGRAALTLAAAAVVLAGGPGPAGATDCPGEAHYNPSAPIPPRCATTTTPPTTTTVPPTTTTDPPVLIPPVTIVRRSPPAPRVPRDPHFAG